MAIKHPLGFTSTVFRKKFGSAMTGRSYRDNEVIFARGILPTLCFTSRKRHGEAHRGRLASQESYNRRPAAG